MTWSTPETRGQFASASVKATRCTRCPWGTSTASSRPTPPLELAILNGLRDWEQGTVCSEVWLGAGRYKGREWARLGHMGCIGAEDEGVRAAMVGDDWEGEAWSHPPPLKRDSPPPPPKPSPGHKGHLRPP